MLQSRNGAELGESLRVIVWDLAHRLRAPISGCQEARADWLKVRGKAESTAWHSRMVRAPSLALPVDAPVVIDCGNHTVTALKTGGRGAGTCCLTAPDHKRLYPPRHTCKLSSVAFLSHIAPPEEPSSLTYFKKGVPGARPHSPNKESKVSRRRYRRFQAQNVSIKEVWHGSLGEGNLRWINPRQQTARLVKSRG